MTKMLVDGGGRLEIWYNSFVEDSIADTTCISAIMRLELVARQEGYAGVERTLERWY